MKSGKTSHSRSTRKILKSAIRAERRKSDLNRTTSDPASASGGGRATSSLDRQIERLLSDIEEATEYAVYHSPKSVGSEWHTLALKGSSEILVRVDCSSAATKRRAVMLGTGETMPFKEWRKSLLAELARVIVRLEHEDAKKGFKPAASRTFDDGIRHGAAWASRTDESDHCRFLAWLQEHDHAPHVNLSQSGFLDGFHEEFVCFSEDGEDDLDLDDEEEWEELCAFWDIDPSWTRHLNSLPDRYLTGFVRGARRIAVKSRAAMRARRKGLDDKIARDAKELAEASARIAERKKRIRKRLRASREGRS